MTTQDTSAAMDIEAYLASGGVLTSPVNVPTRYRGVLLRLMSSFVDSQLAASAGFATSINFAPGIRERIAASRITLEKADHAQRVLDVMQSFGTDVQRYQTQHDWAARVQRDADLAMARHGADMRLLVFHFPLQSWADAVVMNVLQGLATNVQFEEFVRISYSPLAEVFQGIAPIEKKHAQLGLQGLERLCSTDEGRQQAQEAILYWYPRVMASFGYSNSARHEKLVQFGLRHETNEQLLERWQKIAAANLAALQLSLPQPAK